METRSNIISELNYVIQFENLPPVWGTVSVSPFVEVFHFFSHVEIREKFRIEIYFHQIFHVENFRACGIFPHRMKNVWWILHFQKFGEMQNFKMQFLA